MLGSQSVLCRRRAAKTECDLVVVFDALARGLGILVVGIIDEILCAAQMWWGSADAELKLPHTSNVRLARVDCAFSSEIRFAGKSNRVAAFQTRSMGVEEINM
jgi:hypothetical protein